jgi:hypothetical protein
MTYNLICPVVCFSLLVEHIKLQNSMLIAIKAPHGTSVEVPDPDEVCNFALQ